MIKNLIKLGLGLGIIAYLIYLFDFRAVINAISGANPLFLVLAFLVYSFTFLILAIRWEIILSAMGITIPLSSAYYALALSLLSGKVVFYSG